MLKKEAGFHARQLAEYMGLNSGLMARAALWAEQNAFLQSQHKLPPDPSHPNPVARDRFQCPTGNALKVGPIKAEIGWRCKLGPPRKCPEQTWERPLNLQKAITYTDQFAGLGPTGRHGDYRRSFGQPTGLFGAGSLGFYKVAAWNNWFKAYEDEIARLQKEDEAINRLLDHVDDHFRVASREVHRVDPKYVGRTWGQRRRAKKLLKDSLRSIMRSRGAILTLKQQLQASADQSWTNDTKINEKKEWDAELQRATKY